MKMEQIPGEFFTGVNYWESGSAIRMWEKFDPAVIERDLQLLRSAGITHLRIFPLWSEFQPLCALYGPDDVYEYSFGEEPLPDTPAGRAGVSEAACEKFHTFCRLSEQCDMKLIVALITGHMSYRTYCPPAFLGKAILSDPTVMKWQLRFVKYFVTRFREESAIVGWDLGNEPINLPGTTENPDTFYVWCSTIADAAKLCDPSRPVISGLNRASIEKTESNYKAIGEICDIHTEHPYNIFETGDDPLPTMKPILDLAFRCRLGEDMSGVPTFIQEFGATGYMNCSKTSEADFYRASLYTALAHGCHGTMWWCAFDQGQLDDAPYRWNTIGSDYGFFDRNGSAKPLVFENQAFKKNLSRIPGGVLPEHRVDGTILVARDDDALDYEALRVTYLLCKQANLDMDFRYCLDPIKPSPFYILPSISGNKSIPKQRLDALMEQVKNGSVLYLSADTGLFRSIPEITGVDIAYRKRIDAERIMKLGDAQLPIHTTYFYKSEAREAEVVGRDESGEAVFFRHRYGRGWVCFLTLPMERYLAQKPGAFYEDSVPRYAAVYREAAKGAGIVRAADTDNPYIRLTEHPVDDTACLVLAINYHHKPERAKLILQEDCAVSVVFGGTYDGGELCLEKNDAVLLKLVKK